jgi:hypothetical protein
VSALHTTVIAAIRNSVFGLLRIRRSATAGQFDLTIVGTTWAISDNGSCVTANHVFNGAQPRDPADKFFILYVPLNGPQLNFWPVTGFILEDQQRDLAIIQAPPPQNLTSPIGFIPVAAALPDDGADVLTYGCPAPPIANAGVDPNGNLLGINAAPFTHANTGIVAAQYAAGLPNESLLEFNVGWHNGESGGPVIKCDAPAAAIAVMQHYRNIDGPHGVMAGPRRGWALNAILPQLQQAGAIIV